VADTVVGATPDPHASGDDPSRRDFIHIAAGAAAVGVVGRRIFRQRVVTRRTVGKLIGLDFYGLSDLFLGAIANEHGLAAPHGRDRLPFLDRRQIELCRRQGLGAGIRIHLSHEGPKRSSRPDGRECVARDYKKIAAGWLVICVRCHLGLQGV
jgi:hypothetical protein